ncbi:MAG: helix-turn-helix domain-containing protein [Flavobacteriales bacterium]
MELTERLQYIMKLNNLSASEFADKIEVQRSSISHIFSGRNKPSLEFIQKVLTAFPKVSSEWLISGSTSSESVLPEKQEIKTEAIEKIAATPTPTNNNSKQVKKVVIFYTDNTFEEIIKS